MSTDRDIADQPLDDVDATILDTVAELFRAADPVPAGLTPAAWHLFAIFVAAIVSVLVGAFPILTDSMIAVGAVVLTGTSPPAIAC